METLTIIPSKGNEIVLYDHQIPVIEKLMEFIEKSSLQLRVRAYVVMPGGSGKTVVFSELIRRLNQKAIILSPTLTISDQNVDTLRRMSPGVKISVYNGESKDLSGDVLYTTYHSIVRLIKADTLPCDFARVIIFDEGHRALSKERSKIMEHFDAIGIAFTATDKFSEQKSVEQIFKNELHRMSLQEAIEMGILTPLRGFVVETKIDVRSVKLMNRNSLDERVAEKHLNVIARNKIARDYYLENFKGIPAVMFCLSIKHAVDLAKYLSKSSIKAAAVHSGTNKAERREIMRKFNAGELDVLCSRDLLAEGWDSKRVVVEFNLRPTYSWVFAEQRACRVVRPDEGKECGIIVEFQDQYGYKDQPIWIHHLFGVKKFKQGGYVAAPARLHIREKKSFDIGEPVFALPGLRVSNVIREIVRLGFGGIDNKFEDKNLIRDILLSRTDVDYSTMNKSNFLALEFEHFAFHGNGRRLIQKHLGPLWHETKEDYELFITDILGDHLFYSFFNAENGQTDVEEASDEYAQPMLKLTNESLALDIKRVFSTITDREATVTALFFGLPNFLLEMSTSFRRSAERIRKTAENSSRNLSSHETESIEWYRRFIDRISESLSSGEGLGFEEIGEIYDLSRERARQVMSKAIRRMTHTSRSKCLAKYMGYVPGCSVYQLVRPLSGQGFSAWLRERELKNGSVWYEQATE